MSNRAAPVFAYVQARTTYKRQIYSLLSAITVFMLAPSVYGADSQDTNNLTNAIVSPTDYCHSNDITQTSRSTYKNARQQTIDCMLTQLNFYQQKNLSSRQQYFAYKVQAWLNYATYENSIKSKSVAGSQALESGAIILKDLQNNNDEQLSLTTNIPSSSALMRPDLWATLSALKDSSSKKSALKDDGGVITAPRELAFSEVALVWAAAEHCQHGSRQSGTHFRMAERWLDQAREAYVNAHDSQTNVALEQSIVNYYRQYAPLDPHDDVCRGQSLPLTTQAVDSNYRADILSVQSRIIPMPLPTATYRIGY